MITDKFFFFWSGPFSQWARRKMVVDGVTYNTCEQFMMASKAMLFNDKWALEEIMKSDEPHDQKALGRMVKDFDKAKWEAIARDVVYRGNYAKFTQHPELAKKLADTGERIIVEASPEDTIWGIGLRMQDPRAQDPSQWLGTNWLGEALMQVRTKMREEGKI